jgi:hypothetical protein
MRSLVLASIIAHGMSVFALVAASAAPAKPDGIQVRGMVEQPVRQQVLSTPAPRVSKLSRFKASLLQVSTRVRGADLLSSKAIAGGTLTVPARFMSSRPELGSRRELSPTGRGSMGTWLAMVQHACWSGSAGSFTITHFSGRPEE